MKKQVLVSVEDSHLERMPAVVDELKARGLEVKRSMPALGVVSGSADHDKLASLQEIDGVRSVEEERSVQIPPPDSPIQ